MNPLAVFSIVVTFFGLGLMLSSALFGAARGNYVPLYAFISVLMLLCCLWGLHFYLLTRRKRQAKAAEVACKLTGETMAEAMDRMEIVIGGTRR